MRLTQAVVMTTLFFMLPLGLFPYAFASNRLQMFSIHSATNWTTALADCKKNNESLLTLYDEKDAQFLNNFLAKNSAQSGTVWLDLHMTQQSAVSWSDGVPFNFNASKVYIKNNEQICEAMENGTWKGYNCSDRKPFMCNKDNEYILIENVEKNWCQALQHCRRNNLDLVSISNETQNNEVSGKGMSTSFWIGLKHDQWKWESNSCSTYREWSKPSTENGTCSILRFRNVEPLGCDQNKNRVCTKGYVRIKIIQKNFTWEQALDYCKDYHTDLLRIENQEDQNAVRQWLNYTKVQGPFWIGLRQSSLFGFWIWSDRTVGYSNWKNGKTPEMPMSNQCGIISKSNYTWSDENCWRELHFLCEEEILFFK